MTIADKKAVTINYTLKDDNDVVIDTSNDSSFTYLHGANNIIPGLENELTGKKAGDKFSVVIKPEDAYGEYNDKLTQVVDKAAFGEQQAIEPGMQFHAQGENGQMVVITVSKVDGDQVTIDGNHPLSGVTLHYDVEVMDVRDATDDELAHGHIHQHGDSCSH